MIRIPAKNPIGQIVQRIAKGGPPPSVPGYDYALFVGWNAGFLYGYRPPSHPTNSFGEFFPSDKIAGKQIYQFTGNTGGTEIMQLSLGPNGDEFISGVGTITLEMQGFAGGTVLLTWDIDSDRYQVVDLSASNHLKAWYETYPNDPMGINFVY